MKAGTRSAPTAIVLARQRPVLLESIEALPLSEETNCATGGVAIPRAALQRSECSGVSTVRALGLAEDGGRCLHRAAERRHDDQRASR